MLPASGPVLPDFPWDKLAPYKAIAADVPGGISDLSVGTPVDPVPELIQAALAAAANWPGYPQTYGTEPLREAVVNWLERRHGVTGLDQASVLPTIGSKELVAWLPTLLGLRGKLVVIPEVAYPTYEVGAMLAGSDVLRADSLTAIGPQKPGLIWLNTPSNPTGKVLGVDHLRKVVQWARERGVIVASDECYNELGWDAQPVSILHPDVCDGNFDGLLSVQSLSKRSNLAGYRIGFVAGDTELIKSLLEIRKHAGMIVAGPVQDAAIAALNDNVHVAEQKERYRARRTKLKAALEGAGFTIEGSQAGLYLWSTRGESCWDTVDWLANRGILVAPGAFYGPASENFVRVALTATDERVDAACDRLLSS